MKRLILFVLSVFLYSSAIYADVPSVTVTADSATALIGKRINLTIDFQSKKDYDVIFPVIQDSLEKIEVVEMTEPDTSLVNEFRKIQRNYVITSFDSGSYDLGPYSLIYSDNNSDEFNVIKTKPLKVNFNTVKIDTAQPIKDIKPPMSVGWSFSEILPYLLIALLVIALIIIYFYSKRKKSGDKTPWIIDKPKIPAHVEAFEALEKLKKEELWQNGFVKEFHIAITNILRRYIERRFEINAMEMITDDILSEFEKNNHNNELYNKLKDVLTLGDLAKFAKFNPLPEENEKSYDYTYEFVKKTIPVKENNDNKEGENA